MRSLCTVLCMVVIGACGQEPSTCPQNLSIDISNVTLDVFNNVVNGQTGTVSKSFNCTQGGGGTVSGTVGSGTYDLTFVFNSCVYVVSLGTLTLSGSLTQQNALSTHVETGHAEALAISGNETSCLADPIQATCAVDWSFAGRDTSGVPIGTGSVCGLAFP